MKSEITNRDKAYKKNWENRHPQIKAHRFMVNDKVLLRNQETNKWSTPYEKEPYIVIEINGSSIRARRR